MVRSADPPFASLLSHAHALADAAGAAILPFFRRAIPVEAKAAADFDPVTEADRRAERRMSALVSRAFPDHGIVGEEYGTRAPDARWRWYLDPIDGTRSFITGAPTWGTLIGLADGEEPVLGMMDQPWTRERFWSARSASYQRTGDGKPRKLATRACSKLEAAIVMTTSPELFATAEDRAAFERVRGGARMTRYGGDCYAYCLLAAGFVDIVVESGLKPHDIVALVPIIERAGGRVTTWEGRSPMAGGRIVAAGDPRLHDRLVRLLTG